MNAAGEPFNFTGCINMTKATGRKARNVPELRDLIALVSDNCIDHHTFQHFLKGHVLEYTNDFAYWAGEYLGQRALSERLSNIDPYFFTEINDLRKALVEVINKHLSEFPEQREAASGEEFYFSDSVTLTFDIGIRAKNLAELFIALKYVDPSSIYYHFYEARRRLGGRGDDFSKWAGEVLGKGEVSERIKAIDPFMHGIEGIRERIVGILEGEVRKDMEVL